MDYPKSIPNVGLVNGKFIDENTTTGQVGSLIPCSWGNAVTDEILNVIRAGGEEPVEGENDQLVAAIRAIVLDTIPEEQIRTTLAAYGITDAYTKAQTHTKTEIADLVNPIITEAQRLQTLIMPGAHQRLVVSATGTNALVAIRAHRLNVGDGVSVQVLSGLSLNINLATVGLGGLDTGVLAASSWYSGWVATNGVTRAGIAAAMPSLTCATTAGSPVVTGIAGTASMRAGMPFGGATFPPGTIIISVDSPSQITASQPAITTSAAAALLFMYEPVLPAGYTAVRVTAFFTDATNKYPLRYRQRGRQVKWLVAAGTNVVSSRSVTGGIVGTWHATAPTWAEASLVNYVPITAVSASFTAIASYNGAAQSNVCIAPNAAYLGSRTQTPPPISTTLNGGSGAAPDVMSADIMLESMSVFVVSQTAAGAVVIHGYEDDV